MNIFGPFTLVPEYAWLTTSLLDKPVHVTGKPLEALLYVFNFHAKKKKFISNSLRGKKGVHD